MTEQEEIDRLETWLVGRPPLIAEMARRCPPWKFWKLKTDREWTQQGTRYHVYSYGEGGTVQIVRHDVASGRTMYRVFGIDPNDLEEADSPDEARALMDADEILVRTVECEQRMADLEARVAAAAAHDDEDDDEDEKEPWQE